MPASKTRDQLAGFDIEKLHQGCAKLEEELRIMQPDMGAIEDYRLKDAEHTQRLAELEVLTAERDQVPFLPGLSMVTCVVLGCIGSVCG